MKEIDYQDLQFREQKYWSLFKREIDYTKKVELLGLWRETKEKLYEVKENYVLPANE